MGGIFVDIFPTAALWCRIPRLRGRRKRERGAGTLWNTVSLMKRSDISSLTTGGMTQFGARYGIDTSWQAITGRKMIIEDGTPALSCQDREKDGAERN